MEAPANVSIYTLIGAITGAIGSLIGLISIAWRYFDEFGSFLRIGLEIDTDNSGWVIIRTKVENKGFRNKPIKNALLLIGPASETPVETARGLSSYYNFNVNINYTNDLESFFSRKCLRQNDRMIIPLDFYFSENIGIADETLQYSASMPSLPFNNNHPYSVRFFVFASGRMHRSTHDVFIINEV